MMLVIVGLLLVPFPADSNADILVPADSVAAPAQVGLARPLLASGLRALDESQRVGPSVSTGQRSTGTRLLALQPRSTGRRVAAGIVAGVAGFFLGGYLGAQIEPDCACDDPGLKGFLVGAPIGAAVGAIVGSKFF
jgi:hypothetical protein